MKPAIEVNKLVKEYRVRDGIFRAVDDVSFKVLPGEVVGLLGPNGAGKTTTIHMLLSTLRPTAGSIRYFGRELKDHRSELMQQVAFASSYTELPGRLTVLENLHVYGRIYRLSRAERTQRIESFLKHFGVWDQRNKKTSQLSAGQKTRVMLSKAFLAAPKIALLDEPTASLDPDIAHEVRRFVRRQQQEHGVSILYTSHNMDEVSEVCDRVMFLKAGRVVACDTPAMLASRAAKTRLQLHGVERSAVLFAALNSKGVEHTNINGQVEIAVEHDQTGALLSWICSQGIAFQDVHIRKPTLEDYFLQLSEE